MYLVCELCNEDQSSPHGKPMHFESKFVRQHELGKEYSNRYVTKKLVDDTCRFSNILEVFRGPKNKKRCFKVDLTYEVLWHICFPDTAYDESHLKRGLTFEDCRPFYERYGIGDFELGFDGRVLNRIDHKPWCKATPQTMYELNTGGHSHIADDGVVRRRAHTDSLARSNIPTAPKPTAIPRSYKPGKHETVVLDESGTIGGGVTLHDLLLSDDYAGGGDVLALVNRTSDDRCAMIDDILVPLLTVFRINPEVRGSKAGVPDVFVDIKGRKKLHISTSKTMRAALAYVNGDKYELHMKHQTALSRNCRNFSTLSSYGPGVAETLQQKGRGGFPAVIAEGVADKAVDINKHYPAAMMETMELPVVTMFHTWEVMTKPWEEYSDMALFYCTNDKATLYCTYTHALCSGASLKEIDPEDRPTPVLVLNCDSVQNMFRSADGVKGAFETMWDCEEIPMKLRKASLVQELGIWGSGNEVGREMRVFKDKREAYTHNECRGQVIPLASTGFWLSCLPGNPVQRTDGFHLLHHFKLDRAAAIAYRTRKAIEADGTRTVHAAKTDGFMYSGPDFPDVTTDKSFSSIGKLKVEEVQPENMPRCSMNLVDNSDTFVIPKAVPLPEQRVVTLEDEFDQEANANMIQELGCNVMFMAEDDDGTPIPGVERRACQRQYIRRPVLQHPRICCSKPCAGTYAMNPW